MKKIYFIFAAMVGVALTSCSGDELTDTSPTPAVETESPIMFGSLSKGYTRADFKGADAAELLGNQFVVSGYKGTYSEWGKISTTSTLVFDNYVVKYKENTAHTTASNVANWEYVGQDRIKHAIDNGITSQAIKYWDYSAPQYDYIAWSTGKKTAIYTGNPADGEVLVSAITPTTATGTGTDKVAYTFTGKADDLRDCYVADLVTAKKENGDYGKPVTLTFRQLGTKVRIAIYETIPGYSVKDVEFYSAAASNDASASAAKLFTTVANNIYTEGTYKVTFPTVDGSTSDNNKAHVEFTAKTGVDQKTVVDWGGLNYTIAEEGEKTSGKVFLGRTSNTASFAGNPDKNYYVVFLPNEDGTNLNLRVNYTLESIDGGGEEIHVKGATAQVPGIYTTWKPGYAYTYIFKISDKTNGHTGDYNPLFPDDVTVNSDPAGLYPITFDAVVENAEEDNATQETITSVSTPSITTYQKGSKVVNNNEYLASTGNIFVTVNDGGGYVEETVAAGANVSAYYKFDTTTGQYTKCGASETAVDGTKYYRLDPVLANGALQDLTGKAALYTIPAGKTEADVVDALQMQDDDKGSFTIKGRSGLGLIAATFTLTDKVEYGVDGNTIDLTDGTKKKVMQFTPAAGTYAFVYTKTAATAANDKEMYQALDWANFATGQTKYRYDYKAPTKSHTIVDDKGTADTSDDTPIDCYDAQKGGTYFSVSGSVYSKETPFIGQGVGNMYTRSGAGTAADPYVYTIASGYAVTGTTYYYTTDKGMSYQPAHNLAYKDYASTTLYKDPACTTEFTAVEKAGGPFDGTAYYYKDGSDNKYYCVILPQQTDNWYELDTTKYVEATEATAVDGQTYFDKYVKNDGVYYTKIIKVQ